MAAFFLALLSGGPAKAADVTLYGPAKTSLASLAVPTGVRAIGMGEAYTAAGGDASSLNWNPAGLARQKGYELSLAHNEWSTSLGLRQENLSYGQGLKNDAGLAAALSYFSLGTLQGRDSEGAPLADESPFALGLSAGYGRSLPGYERLKLGAAAEFAMENYFSSSQSGFSASTGLAYDFSADYSAGFSLMHLGSPAAGLSPPSSASLGVAGYFLERALLLALDASQPFSGGPRIKAGAEYNLGALQLRAGYRLALGAGEGDVQSGLSAGAGFKASVFRIDYAYAPYGELLSSHRLALSVVLPDYYFEPRSVGAEAGTVTARACYDQGQELEKEGKLVEAMVQYQMVENAYPESMEDHPQDFYLSAQEKMNAIRADMEKKGGKDAEMAAFIQAHAKRARGLFDQGRPAESLAELKQVEAFDKSSVMVIKLRSDVEAGIRSQLHDLKFEARAAGAAGNLALEVECYMKVQAVDAGDHDAASFFYDRRADIGALLTRIHRKGIDLYVADKLEEAISVWKTGKAIDVDKGRTVDFDRDIRKARIRIEQRGAK